MGYSIIKNGELRQRVEKCIKFRNTENPAAAEIQQGVKESPNEMIPEIMLSAMNQLTGGIGMLDAAGLTMDEVLECWCDLMEKKHPHLKL